MPISDELKERLRFRIEALANRGDDICQEFRPMPSEDGGGGMSSCHRCHYTADAHLLRDLHVAIKFKGWR